MHFCCTPSTPEMPTSYCRTAIGARSEQLLLLLLLLFVLLFLFLIRLRGWAKICTTGTVQQHATQQHYQQLIAQWLGLYTYVHRGNALIVIIRQALLRLKNTDPACRPSHASNLRSSTPLRQPPEFLRLAGPTVGRMIRNDRQLEP